MVSRGYDGLPADAGCAGAEVSADGDWVVFHTAASNLVRGDTNGLADVFFFQAEDGIRRKLVTGVQTCALPISGCSARPVPGRPPPPACRDAGPCSARP